MDDLTLLLSDDNFANLRTVPTPELKDRKPGWGIYYHFDYHGDPISYEWVNSTPITKAWEQLTSAYEYGIRKLWICNVGDVRPVELPLSYFMDLAFDFDYWQQPNKTGEYLSKWVKEQFAEVSDADRDAIGNLLNDYINMNGRRRPEATHPDTFDIPSNQAFIELRYADKIISNAEKLKANLPSEIFDKFYGLVYFPAVASANLRRMMVLAGIYNIVTNTDFIVSNYLAEEINKTIDRDIELVRFYNEDMSGGKWKYMMSSKHVNFQHWNDEDSEYPKPVIKAVVSSEKSAKVVIERSECFFEGECSLPEMDINDPAPKEVYILEESIREDPFRLEYDNSRLDIRIVKITDGAFRLDIKVVKAGESSINVVFESHAVTIKTSAIDSKSITDVPCMAGGSLSMLCDSYSRKNEPGDSSFLTIDNYGLSGKAIKIYPLAKDYSIETAPSLTYDFYLPHDGSYEVSVFVAPSNNTFKNQNLSFALKMDDTEDKKIDLFPEGYMAGYGTDANWSEAVLRNCRELKASYTLGAGKHSLEYKVIDSMVVLQRIVITKK